MSTKGEAFNKWVECGSGTGCYEDSTVDLCEKGWRAALEWARDKSTATWIKDINQELGEMDR